MNSLKMGIKIESEHKHTYNLIKKYVKKHGKMPPKRTVFADIAKDHIKELGRQYYPNLVRMETRLKRKR